MSTGLIGGNRVADELSREEVSSRLEEIFSSSLEGDQLEKAVSSIPKRLDKFEGKWDGLIKWAEQKYGTNESAVEAAEEPAEEASEEPAEEAAEEPAEEPAEETAEEAAVETAEEPAEEAAEEAAEETTEEDQTDSPTDDKPAKKGGLFSKFGRRKSKKTETQPSDENEGTEQAENRDTISEEISREQASSRLEEIFNSGLEGQELEKAIDSIPTRLDKFEGKWPKLIIWAESKYPPLSGSGESDIPIDASDEDNGSSIESIVSMIDSGDMDSALSNLKMMISSESDNPEVWIAMASYFSSIGHSGRSKACEEKAASLIQ